MIVVKVGGSLYDHPRLGPGLRTFLQSLPEPVLLVPGGGRFANGVREWDRIHGLGEERSHWLALEAMDLGGELLASFELPATILDAVAFCREHDELPHTWDATSDSVAALAATVHRATRLVLLKSVAIPVNTTWEDAAMKNQVDGFFPKLVAEAHIPVEVVNFRQWTDAIREVTSAPA